MDQGVEDRSVHGAPGLSGVLPIRPKPCPMPSQVLWPTRKTSSRPAPSVRLARWILLALWTGATSAFAWTLYRVLSVETPTVLQLAFLGLSTLCFAWVAVGSSTALIGFDLAGSRANCRHISTVESLIV